MKYMAVIPCRAGSQGVLHKNVRPIAGSSLLDITIAHALESKRLDGIVVSTNDPLAKDICMKYGSLIEVIDRPEDISGPTSASELALIHAIKQKPKEPEFVVMLQPSSPFRLDGLIDRCIFSLERNNADCLLTTLKMYDFFWMQRKDEFTKSWSWVSSYEPRYRKMRQSMLPDDLKYFDNGNIYITRTSVLKESQSRILNNSHCKIDIFPVSQLESFQVDTMEEFRHAECILRGLTEQEIEKNTIKEILAAVELTSN